MSTILLATDGSEHAAAAAGLAGSIAWPKSTEFVVVAVVPSFADLAGLPWTPVVPSNVEEVEAAELQRAQESTRAALEALRLAGLSASWTIMRGRPADAIVDLAERRGAELIVMGSRGMGAFRSALLGSVSAEVIDRAPCAVLVARSERLGRTLIADDGSPEAEVARAFVLARPHLLGAETRLVGVVPMETLWPDALAPLDPRTAAMLVESRTAVRMGLETRLARDAAELVAAGVNTTREVRDGIPAHEVAAAAEACEAGLIVVGTHGRRGMARLAIGSVSRGIVHHAHCSVLVVHAPVATGSGHVTADAPPTTAQDPPRVVPSATTGSEDRVAQEEARPALV